MGFVNHRSWLTCALLLLATLPSIQAKGKTLTSTIAVNRHGSTCPAFLLPTPKHQHTRTHLPHTPHTKGRLPACSSACPALNYRRCTDPAGVTHKIQCNMALTGQILAWPTTPHAKREFTPDFPSCLRECDLVVGCQGVSYQYSNCLLYGAVVGLEYSEGSVSGLRVSNGNSSAVPSLSAFPTGLSAAPTGAPTGAVNSTAWSWQPRRVVV